MTDLSSAKGRRSFVVPRPGLPTPASVGPRSLQGRASLLVSLALIALSKRSISSSVRADADGSSTAMCVLPAAVEPQSLLQSREGGGGLGARGSWRQSSFSKGRVGGKNGRWRELADSQAGMAESSRSVRALLAACCLLLAQRQGACLRSSHAHAGLSCRQTAVSRRFWLQRPARRDSEKEKKKSARTPTAPAIARQGAERLCLSAHFSFQLSLYYTQLYAMEQNAASSTQSGLGDWCAWASALLLQNLSRMFAGGLISPYSFSTFRSSLK